MIDYQIQANTRRCTATGRELKPGERFYTVLLDEAGKFIRQDYSSEAWQGPPTNAFSFWAGRVPELDADRRPRFDDDMLMECFQRLTPDVAERERAFPLPPVLRGDGGGEGREHPAIAHLTLTPALSHEYMGEGEKTNLSSPLQEGDGQGANVTNFRYVVGLLLMRRKRLRFENAWKDGEREILQLRCVRTSVKYEVVNPQLSETEIGEVQEEVFKLLGWE